MMGILEPLNLWQCISIKNPTVSAIPCTLLISLCEILSISNLPQRVALQKTHKRHNLTLIHEKCVLNDTKWIASICSHFREVFKMFVSCLPFTGNSFTVLEGLIFKYNKMNVVEILNIGVYLWRTGMAVQVCDEICVFILHIF